MMQLTSNEAIFILWLVGILLSIFFGCVVWILNKGVNRMEDMAKSLNNMERDFKVLVNDHQNLKEDVEQINIRVQRLEHYK